MWSAPAPFARACPPPSPGGEVLLDAVIARICAETFGAILASTARGRILRFERTVDAVQFATALQLELLGVDWPATLLVRPEASEERGQDGSLLFRGLRVRAAIHRGRVFDAPDGGIDGPAIYQVARVAAVAHGGQVLVTGAAADGIGDLGPAVITRALGTHSLAAVDGELTLLQVLPAELDARRFPDVETQHIRRSNVPPSDEPLFGRQGDLAALSELIHLGVRANRGRGGLGRRQEPDRAAVRGRPRGGRALPPAACGSAGVDEPTVGALCRATLVGPGRAPRRARLGHRGGRSARLRAGGAGRAAARHRRRHPPPTPRCATPSRRGCARRRGCACSSTPAGGCASGGEVEYQVKPLLLSTAQNPPPGRRAADLRDARSRDRRGLHGRRPGDAVRARGGRSAGGPCRSGSSPASSIGCPPEQQLQQVRDGTLHPSRLLAPLIELLDADEFNALVACSALPGSFDVRALDGFGDGALRIVDRLERRGLVQDHLDPSAVGIHRYTVESAVVDLVLERIPEVERRSLRERRAMALVRACTPLLDLAGRADRPEIGRPDRGRLGRAARGGPDRPRSGPRGSRGRRARAAGLPGAQAGPRGARAPVRRARDPRRRPAPVRRHPRQRLAAAAAGPRDAGRAQPVGEPPSGCPRRPRSRRLHRRSVVGSPGRAARVDRKGARAGQRRRVVRRRRHPVARHRRERRRQRPDRLGDRRVGPRGGQPARGPDRRGDRPARGRDRAPRQARRRPRGRPRPGLARPAPPPVGPVRGGRRSVRPRESRACGRSGASGARARCARRSA